MKHRGAGGVQHKRIPTRIPNINLNDASRVGCGMHHHRSLRAIDMHFLLSI